MQSAITHLFAGVPVCDPRGGHRPFIEPNARGAGAGRITLAVAGLDALLERPAAGGTEHAIAFAEPADARAPSLAKVMEQ